MKTAAAVLVETGKPLVLVELEIPPLKAGQVLVEIAFSGVCHTQLLEWRGYRGKDPNLPHCMGHEGSGLVREVGPEVTKVRVGDPVILSWMKGSGTESGGTTYRWADQMVNAGAITTFSRHSVISENRLTILPAGISLRQAALLGCAVATGVGAVCNTASAKPGQSIAVFGVGGVGLCAVAGAVVAGCSPIIAIDVRETRLAVAKRMGATHCINASTVDSLKVISDICRGRLDCAVEVTGRPQVMAQAFSSVRPQGGVAVIVGNARADERLELDPKQFNLGKRLLGTWGGDNWPDRDFPHYCELVANGKINIEFLLSRSYDLKDINRALHDLETGEAVRPLVDMTLDC